MGMKRITGLWKNDGAKGTYLSGKLNEDLDLPAGSKIFVFIENQRKGEKSPTHSLNVADDEQAPSAPPASSEW